MADRPPKVTVLYHYFHPDDVISARYFEDLCIDLARRGWEVEAWPSNRGCRDETVTYPLHEEWHGVTIRRVGRPRLQQASAVGRIVNMLWILAAWAIRACRRHRHRREVLVVGTDPVLSVLVAIPVRWLCPNIRIVHCCHDLHPEGMIADGLLPADSWLTRLLRRWLRRAYAACDLVVDLGACMRRRLDAYGHSSRKLTLPPWSLVEPVKVEPAAPTARRELFGDSPLGLLYSGNFGRAHSYSEFLQLARRLRGSGVDFCFGVRGNRVAELQAALRRDDWNVSIAGFAPEADLAERLRTADIHLVSLRPEWTGVVIPSKFFGALAAGRPVLFAGSRDSALARWIEEYGLGWVLDSQSQEEIARQLIELTTAKEKLFTLQRHCHEVYQKHFSREHTMNRWHSELSLLLFAPRGTS